MKRRTASLGGGAVLAMAAAAVWWNAPGPIAARPDPTTIAATAIPPTSAAAELWALRGQDQDGVLDDFVSAQIERAAATPDDPAAWRLLAEAHLERCLHRDRRLGMAVGEPLYDALPPGHAEDIDQGLVAADRAIRLGDPTGDAWRIRSGLLSLRITGLAAYMQHRPAAKQALAEAAAIDPDSPRVLQARAMEKLLSPPWFGHDPAAAAVDLEAVAQALPFDERPLVSLAFAHHLLGDRAAAIAALDRALQRNPDHAYARVVRARLGADEDRPFARPVD